MDAWYTKSFGDDYLLVYKHRDMEGAAAEVKAMINWLKLPDQATVLDLCCGTGRHSQALAEAGYRVTGVDLSDRLLEEAHKTNSDGKIRFVRGDMRHVPLEGPFDAVVNLFTSFGYFDEERENQLVLREIARLLKPEGRFIIDYLNAPYIAERLVPYSEREDGGVRIEERRSLEDGFVRKRISIRSAEAPEQERHYMEQVKLYGLADFKRLLKGTGLLLDRIYGGYDGSEYDPVHSTRLIMTGHKGEETAIE
ncbi:class I SAM-dependent methyltransferase [Paenibacillus turpanensis]|uniref:class I SAM-dependent methyltransferase n=1 Tax=Paenibacillus turpanensis TaxID=2689078 RepID=UPI001408ECF1|nr:class I SAM-dependent methyltransferase [Paenibacillus turpanensis]